MQTLRERAHARTHRVVRKQPLDRAPQLVRFVAVRVEPQAEAELVHALRVVVLIPEERQDDHRLPEVEALRDRVVAAVRDHEVDVGEDRRLREKLGAAHVVGQLVLVVLRSFRDDEAMRTVGERRDEPAHQLDVRRAEAAE